MSITADIKTILEADETLMDILTGGVHDAAEINRQLTPGAFDANGEILPCCLVKTGNETSRENVIRAVQTPLTLYFYQYSGFDQVDAALFRVHTLLEMTHIGNSQVWQVRFESEITRALDDALNCSLAVQRYNLIRKKS